MHSSMELVKIYKRFVLQRITHYNGQWHCYPCKSTLQSLADVECHLQEAHPDNSTQISQISDFLDKSTELDIIYSILVNHGIIMRDEPQDYFCIPCQRSISSLNDIAAHSEGKKHKKCIETITISKDSTNNQQNSDNNINGKQNNVSVNRETPIKHENKSNTSVIINSTRENKLVTNFSHGSAQMTNGTITNAYVPSSFMHKTDMYKRFLIQRITRYNGQWYCYLCKSMLQSLENVERHLQKVHPNTNTQISDFLDKSIKSSNIKCIELVNHGIVIRDEPQGYFCVPCQCLIPSLDHIIAHSKGKKHQECIKTSTISKDSTNDQQNSSNNISGKQNNVSAKETTIKHENKSEISVKINPICENKLVTDFSNGSAQMTNGTIANTYVSSSFMHKTDMYKRFLIQRITCYNGQWYCYLCKSMLRSLENVERHLQKVHPNTSTEISDFLDKSIKSSNTKCIELVNHGIVIRDEPQDYFCVPCQCLIPSLDHIIAHSKGKKHKKCIKTSTISKDSTNNQQNSSNNISGKQNNVSAKETTIKHENKSKISGKINPICENKLVTDFSNGSAQMRNGTIANTYVPSSFMHKTDMYKRFLIQRITRYNGQWYCYLCKSMLRSLENVERHLQKVHPNTSTQISDFLDKSIKSSNIKCIKLVNHGIVIRDEPQGYFCVPCQCLIPSLDHIIAHSKGKKHQECIKTSTISKDSTNAQQNSNNDINDKQNNGSVNTKTLIKRDESKFLTEMQPICENDLVKDLSHNSKTEKEISFKSCEKNSNSDNVLQIERSVNMAFCYLCDMFIHKTQVKCHELTEVHVSTISALKIFNRPAICVINLEEERKIIKPLQLNSRKLNGTIWPEHIKITTNYTCDQCNKIIKENDLINHEITVHKNSISKFSVRNINWSCKTENIDTSSYYPIFKCSFCNKIIHGISSLQTHFSKPEHEKNINLLIKIKRQEHDNCKDIQRYFEPLEFLNLISFQNSDEIMQTMEQPLIYIKNHCTTLYNSNNSIQKKFTYICIACECKFFEIKNIINHLNQTKIHSKHLKNVLLTYSYIYNLSTSKEFRDKSVNKTQIIKTPYKDVSIINTLEKCNINKTQINTTQYRISNLITATDSNDKNDTLNKNEESNSGLFVPPSIFMEINKLIQLEAKKYLPIGKHNVTNKSKKNDKSALDRYNRIYQKNFLDFEEIMFVCNREKLKEIKLNLQFYVPCFNETMFCLVCNITHSYDIRAFYEHIHCDQHVTQLTQLRESSEELKLELLKELMKVESINVKCHACSKKWMYHNDSKIKDHIHFSSHKKNREKLFKQAENILEELEILWYSIRYFACIGCNVKFEMKIEFMEHLNKKHKAVLNTRDNLKFDFCITCAILWYKEEDFIMTYQRHCQNQTHRYLVKSNDFAITSLPQSLQELLKNIDGTIVDLFKLSNDTLSNPKSTQLMDALKHIFETQQFPVKVYMFGSRVTGLALPNSDVDIYLNFGDECIEAESIERRSKQIQDYLRTDSDNWEIESILDKSRTPIIKLRHRLTRLQCDISFTNGLSVENTKFIKSFNMAYPSCRKLILFLKKWILLGGLTDFGGITNYALTWLVIFYLQVKYKIPNIAALIENHKQSKIVSGWETGVGDAVPINCPNQVSELPIYELLLGFFEYYRDFDYKHFVVCPLLGDTCRKESFTEVSLTEVSALPNAMALYVKQLRSAKPEYFRVDSPMCIQDPFDLSHNLTKAVQILTLKRFRQYCNESALMLCNLQLCQEEFDI